MRSRIFYRKFGGTPCMLFAYPPFLPYVAMNEADFKRWLSWELKFAWTFYRPNFGHITKVLFANASCCLSLRKLDWPLEANYKVPEIGSIPSWFVTVWIIWPPSCAWKKVFFATFLFCMKKYFCLSTFQKSTFCLFTFHKKVGILAPYFAWKQFLASFWAWKTFFCLFSKHEKNKTQL